MMTSFRNEAAPPRKPVKRTYGSRSFSDKENQAEPQGDTIEVSGDVFAPSEDEDPFASGDEGDTTQADFGDELKKAAKKFKEVDKWELEFEEVVQSSSPKAAR
ncbi:hypothetical protein NKR23_g2380 [Pleurostoma richardsiae]|uniref:Uncharacterized protein n=1 Tax=Pleurostoma richardsiae TaxID=41990 RepID=A0AA38VNI8_9PEZI|nr:hypothetical protein NKR23_g2380 [Pleurostoma richardsiae]